MKKTSLKNEILQALKLEAARTLGKMLDLGFEHSKKLQMMLKVETENVNSINAVSNGVGYVTQVVNHNTNILKQIMTARDNMPDLFTKKQDEKPN